MMRTALTYLSLLFDSLTNISSESIKYSIVVARKLGNVSL